MSSKTKIMFKSYTSNDNLFLPPCLEDFISSDDPVRVVHRVIESVNLQELYDVYHRKECFAYYPRMIYAYFLNIYSSCCIEEFCYYDIRFMWL